MISGPILRYGEMEKQMYESRRFDYKRVTFGMQRMILGFLKKLVISERLALIANEVFNNYQSYSGISIWVGVAAFTFQLYTDFDGCMDIVLGCRSASASGFRKISARRFWRGAFRNTGADGTSAWKLAEGLSVLSAAADEVFYDASQKAER